MQPQELPLQDPPLHKEQARGWAFQNSSNNTFISFGYSYAYFPISVLAS